MAPTEGLAPTQAAANLLPNSQAGKSQLAAAEPAAPAEASPAEPSQRLVVPHRQPKPEAALYAEARVLVNASPVGASEVALLRWRRLVEASARLVVEVPTILPLRWTGSRLSLLTQSLLTAARASHLARRAPPQQRGQVTMGIKPDESVAAEAPEPMGMPVHRHTPCGNSTHHIGRTDGVDRGGAERHDAHTQPREPRPPAPASRRGLVEGHSAAKEVRAWCSKSTH